MRRLILFVPLLVFFVMGIFLWRGLQLDPSKLPSALLDKPVPAFSLPSLQQPERMLSELDLKGQPALLNVWATWCPSCKQEHPHLNRIKDEGYRIIGLNYKDERVKALAWLDRYLNPYAEVIFDEKGSLGLDLGVYGAPETYVVDANGTIRYKHVGVVDERVWQQIKPMLDQMASGEQVTQ